MSAPLRKIVARPEPLTEVLECGHSIPRPLGLGEFAMAPSKAKSRRCWKCEAARTDTLRIIREFLR